MPAAARIGDTTGHVGGTIGGGPPLARNVYIEQRLAAVMGDAHVCTTPPQHLNKTVLIGGSGQVFICGAGAARVGDAAACGARITSGAQKVWIGG